METIADCAFSSNYALTSVFIPKSVVKISSNAFMNNYELSTIVVDEENTVYDSRDDCNAIIETSSNTLIVGCQSTIIPESVVSIDRAFMGCRSLKSITLPSSIMSINEEAFLFCDFLSSVTSYIKNPPSITWRTFSYEVGTGPWEQADGITLSIPYNTKDAYLNAGWRNFKEIIEMDDPNADTDLSKIDNTVYINPTSRL